MFWVVHEMHLFNLQFVCHHLNATKHDFILLFYYKTTTLINMQTYAYRPFYLQH